MPLRTHEPEMRFAVFSLSPRPVKTKMSPLLATDSIVVDIASMQKRISQRTRLRLIAKMMLPTSPKIAASRDKILGSMFPLCPTPISWNTDRRLIWRHVRITWTGKIQTAESTEDSQSRPEKTWNRGWTFEHPLLVVVFPRRFPDRRARP